MRSTHETLGKTQYVTGWKLVRREVNPKFVPPPQPCGAWKRKDAVKAGALREDHD